MRAELDRTLFFGVALIAVVLIGWLLWYFSEAPANRPGFFEAQYRWAEAEEIKLGHDPKAVFGLDYYRMHPEVWDQRPMIPAAPIPAVGSPVPMGLDPKVKARMIPGG